MILKQASELKDGSWIDGREAAKRNEEIENEIMEIFRSHNLTYGQAEEILRECSSRIYGIIANYSF